jgi:hypothetical protein
LIGDGVVATVVSELGVLGEQGEVGMADRVDHEMSVVLFLVVLLGAPLFPQLCVERRTMLGDETARCDIVDYAINSRCPPPDAASSYHQLQ